MRKTDFNTLQIDDITIHSFDGNVHIVIDWSANVGFGQYTVNYNAKTKKWIGLSECMDRGEDKDFLRTLLGKFADIVEIEE